MQYPSRVGPVLNDAAPFGPEMVQGSAPPRYREVLELRVGWLGWVPDVVAFSPEMVQGVRRDRPRYTSQPFGWTTWPVTHDVAPFSPEMTQGWGPRRGVDPRPDRHSGWQTAQLTHVAAAFGPEMVQGTAPARYRQVLATRPGWSVWISDIQILSVEMFQGARPDRARLFLAPRIPLPWSQTTHDEAPFGPEMIQGWHPSRGVDPRHNRHQGWSVAQTTHDSAAFSVEMTQGTTVLRFRERLPLRTGWSNWVSDLQVLSPEMTMGYHPDQPRIRLAPRIPLPWSETTPVPAAFSIDMVQGSAPGRFRERLSLRQGWSVWPVDVAPFSPDMVQGWHPDRPRLFTAPRIPLPTAQVTHTTAPFSQEMVQGAHPDRPRPSHGMIGLTALGVGPDTFVVTVKRDLTTLGTELSFVVGPDGVLGGRGSF